MITRYCVTLLQAGTLISALIGSLCYAADQKKGPRIEKAAQSAPKQQPKPNPNERFNTFARDIYTLKDPTTEKAEEFKKFLEKEKKALNSKPQCKKELDLALEDFNAKLAVATLTQERRTPKEDAITNITKINQAQKMGIPTPSVTDLIEKVKAEYKAQQEAQKTTESPVSITQPTTPVVTTPTPITQKTDTTKVLPQQIKQKEAQPEQESVSTQPLQQQDLETINPLEAETEEEFVAPEVTSQQALIILETINIQPSKDALKIVSYVEPTFFTDVIKPLIAIATQESQQKRVSGVINTAFRVMPTFDISIQQNIAKTMSSIIKTAQEPEGQRALVVQTQKLTQDLPKTRVTTPGLQAEFKKIGITNIPTTTVKNKPENESISIKTVRPSTFELIYNSTLEPDASKAVADTITNATALVTRKIQELAPIVGTALVVAPNPKLTRDVTHAYAINLDQFDLLITPTQLRVKKLTSELTTFNETKGVVKSAGGWLSTLTLGFSGTRYRTPQEILPQLIMLYYILQTVGRETVYGINQAEENIVYLTDSNTQQQLATGSLDLTPYIDREEYGLTPIHQKRNYSDELEALITQINNVIETEIKKVINTQDKEKLSKQFLQATIPIDTYHAVA